MRVSSLTLDREELLSLCRLLQQRANAAREIEVTAYLQGDLTDEQYEKNVQTLRDGFELRVTIAGKNGENLWGSVDDVFASPNFPDEVKSLYVDSGTTLKATQNYYVRNSFVIFLDFGKPKVLDFTFLPSQATPNESNIKVQGYDPTWVNGVFAELKKFIDARSSSFSVVHSHSIYDVLLWVLGFPLGFWLCFRFSRFIEASLVGYSAFVVNAAYVYVFVATLFLFRFFFHYLRWVCPLVEYRGRQSKVVAHRLVLSTIAISVVGSFVYDLIKLLTP